MITLPGMIHLDQLIATLMQVVIECAGAETGALVLLEENQLTVVAQCSGSRPCDLERHAVADCATIPVSVIRSVKRTQETLVLDDAVSEPPFSTDPYIQHHQTRSLLCMPILQQSQLIGILYLENNLSTGVFTNDRLQVLKLLMAQAAISLENARLYKQLEDYAETLERKVEAQTQALQQEIAERQQTEVALRQSEANYRNLLQTAQRSEAKFRNIFENSQVGIFRTRFSDGLILDANQRFADLFGYNSPEEVIGLKYTTDCYVNPSDRQQAIELLKRDGELQNFEVQLQKRDGTLFWGLHSTRLNAADECMEGVIADISDLKQAEAALRQSEANYRNLLQTANSIIIRYDPQGRIHYINDYGVKLLGYEEHEILGRTVFETIIPDIEISGRDMKPFVHNLLRDPQSYPRGEGENLCRDGRRVWMEWSNQAIFNEQGELVEILSVGNDTTQRKQAEEALQRSETKFRAIFENSQVGIFRTRLSDGLLLDANQRLADLFGFNSPNEMIGLEHATDYYVNPSDRQQVVELLKRHGDLQNVEIQMRKRDGTAFWGLYSFRLNATDGYMEGVATDISDRKQAEEALQRSEAKFRAIFENSQVGIFRTRLSDGLILNANQCLANLLGFDSPEEIIGVEYCIGYFVSPSDHQQSIEVLNRDGGVRSHEVQMRKRDGTVFWVLSSSYLNTDDDYIEGVVADISDRKQAEAALQASEAELRALFSAIPDPLFVYNAEGQVIDAIPGNPSYGEEYREEYREEYIGKTLHQLYAKEQADEFLDYIQQVVKTQQVLTVEYIECQWIARREVWFSARIAPIRHEQVIWLARDITLQKQAEAASILEERNRMAREIHDTLAQAFTGILAQVGAAKQVLTDDVEATQAHLDLIKELARTGLTEARRSVVALRPQLLEEGSLQSALHRLVAQIRAAATDTTLYYEIEGAVYSLPAEVENNLLRIGQEALTNAIKHANADEIRVELVYDRDQVCLRVKDNGQGFGVGNMPACEGFGLLGMSERAERIGAQLTIRSQPGQGTEIIVVVGV
jgi:PAS domain S-box-containing protein